MENQGASVVISHHIKDGKQKDYEKWLEEIGPACRNSKGNIDWQIIRPIPNLTFVYTVIIRFDTIENLKNWIQSDIRNLLIEKARSMLAKDDKYYINSGLDFLFQSEQENKKTPVRWKQYLVTWSAIFPLSIAVPLVLLPLLGFLKLPESKIVNSFFISGTIVFLMVYVLMPYYTKLIKNWLYR